MGVQRPFNALDITKSEEGVSGKQVYERKGLNRNTFLNVLFLLFEYTNKMVLLVVVVLRFDCLRMPHILWKRKRNASERAH